MTTVTETRTLIEATLEGDPALASLAVTGVSPKTLAANIAPAYPAGLSAGPVKPFTNAQLVLAVGDLFWETEQKSLSAILH